MSRTRCSDRKSLAAYCECGEEYRFGLKALKSGKGRGTSSARLIAMANALFTKEELCELYERQHLSRRMIAELKGCHLKTVQNYLVRYDIPRRSVHKYIKRPFSGDPLEKAYLIGFGVGDLCVHRANYSKTSKTVIAACTSTVPEQIELVRMLFEEYGGVNLSVGKQQTVITCYLDRSFSFLLEREDRIVDWIMADQECFAAYLAGYIDAEGCIQLKRQTRASEVVIRSYDVNILRTCWTALQKLGVVCPPVYLVKRQGERDGNGPLYHQDYWGLGIYRQLSLARLFELIAPYLKHPKRRQDMLMAWKNVEARMGRSNGG